MTSGTSDLDRLDLAARGRRRASVRPPPSRGCVSATRTLRQRTSRSGWWSASSARNPIRTTNAIASGNDAHSNVFTISSPARAQPGKAASAAAISASASRGIASHSTRRAPTRPHSGRARLPRPPRSPVAHRGRARPRVGLTLHWADGTASRFGLEELRRNCPCAECRGLREQGLDVVADARSRPQPLRASRAELVGGWGLTDPLERRPRDRHLRVEHAARPGRRRRRTDAERSGAESRSLHRKRWCTSARTIGAGLRVGRSSSPGRGRSRACGARAAACRVSMPFGRHREAERVAEPHDRGDDRGVLGLACREPR